jgi:hypothetical protein
MADDAGLPLSAGAAAGPADERSLSPVCPWCSASLPAAEVAVCPSCEARLVGSDDIEIPGLTAVDPALLAVAAAPRKVKRTFGSLLVGNDDEIPPPSEAEMPALARPDADVRREILRLEMEARLVALRAEVASRSAEGAGPAANGGPASEAGPATAEPPHNGEPPETGASPETGEPPHSGEPPETGESPERD